MTEGIDSRLLAAVQQTMPSPHPWDGQMPEEAAAIGWVMWLPDVVAHRKAREFRRRINKLPLRQMLKMIKVIDELDPFVWQESACQMCQPGLAAMWGNHWHRKRDGALVPPAVLGVEF